MLGAIVAALPTATAVAQPWTHLAIEGGLVRRFAVDPTDSARVLVLSHSALWPLFESTDGGAHWHPLGSGLGVGSALAFAPSSPSTLFAIGVEGQTYRSTDAGASFAPVGDALEGLAGARALVVDPFDPTRLLAGGRENEGIHRSTDGGATWSGPLTVNVPPTVYGLLWKPATPDTVFACGQSSPNVARSTDGGANWAEIGAGIGAGAVTDLALEPGDSRLRGLHVRYEPSLQGVRTKVVYSTNEGGSWLDEPLWPIVTGFGIRLLTDGPHLATIASSLDLPHSALESLDGVSWAIDPIPESSFLTDGGWASLDGGAPSVLLAGGISRGPLRRLGADEPWVQGSGYTLAYVSDFAIGGPSQDLLYAAAAHLRISSDRGDTWTDLAAAPAPMHLVEVDRVDPSLLIGGNPPSGVARSTDGGVTWTSIPEPPDLGSAPLRALQATGATGTFLAATDNDFFRSTDAGSTWSAVTGIAGSLPGERLLASARSGPIAYAALFRDLGGSMYESSFYRSTDAGASWALTGAPDADAFTAIAVHPLNPSRLLVVRGTGAWSSADGGTTWLPITLPAAAEAPFNDPVIAADGRFWLGTAESGLWSSGDGGATWKLEGFDDLPAGALAVTPDAVYVQVINSGAFRRDVDPGFFSDGFESGDTQAWLTAPP